MAEGAPIGVSFSGVAAFSKFFKLFSNSTGSINFFRGNGGGPNIALTSLKLRVSFFNNSSASYKKEINNKCVRYMTMFQSSSLMYASTGERARQQMDCIILSFIQMIMVDETFLYKQFIEIMVIKNLYKKSVGGLGRERFFLNGNVRGFDSLRWHVFISLTVKKHIGQNVHLRSCLADYVTNPSSQSLRSSYSPFLADPYFV